MDAALLRHHLSQLQQYPRIAAVLLLLLLGLAGIVTISSWQRIHQALPTAISQSSAAQAFVPNSGLIQFLNAPATQLSTLPIQLVGIYYDSDHPTHSVAVITTTNGQIKAYTLGDSPLPGVFIKAITAADIRLQHDDQEERLPLNQAYLPQFGTAQ